MHIAVATAGLQVSPLFGHCTDFTCYKIERGIIVECQNMPNHELSVKRQAALLRELNVHVLITGSIERHATEAFSAAQIELVPNQKGSARSVAESYLASTLQGNDEEEFNGPPQNEKRPPAR